MSFSSALRTRIKRSVALTLAALTSLEPLLVDLSVHFPHNHDVQVSIEQLSHWIFLRCWGPWWPQEWSVVMFLITVEFHG